MAEASIVTTISIAVLTTALTLLGTSLQQANQDSRADSLRFLDGAHATIQETIAVLNDGYNALEKLVSEAETKGWDKFSQTDWNDYRTFHRQWRQKLTSQHFKLTRYFGKDLADNLINLDRPKRLDKEMIDGNHVDGKKTYNIEQLASDVEFMTRLITLNQDIIDQSFNKQKANGAFEAMDEKRKNADTASKMLEQYNQGSVELIKELESRLTQLGAASVKVVRINNDQ